ncbi:MAG: hypothetical protein HYV68_00310 [Candidatus Taylorbacteria bacterium]|nr:hypothetical protein [Candidatus Taylorbacteria bacterium]
MRNHLYRTILSLILAASPIVAGAQASLFISPASGDYRVGTNFSVLVNVNSGGMPINASTAQINFDRSKLSVVSVGYSQSVFKLWPAEPEFDNNAGTIIFSGGLPSPGFTGSDGALLRITFRPKAAGSASVVFVNGSVLANDGIGTNIADSLRGAVYRIQEAVKPTPAPTPTPAPAPTPIPTPEAVPLPRLETPLFTFWPKELDSGKMLLVEGAAASSSKITLSISKDGQVPVTDVTYSWPTGKFQYTMKTAPDAGIYQITAIAESLDGRKSDPSEPISVTVNAATSVCFGKACVDRASIIRITLYLLIFLVLVFMLLLVIYLWLKTRELENRQKEELKKLGGVETEIGGMIDDFKRLETSDQSYKAEVTADIDKLAVLKEEVMGEIKELRRSIEAGTAAKGREKEEKIAAQETESPESSEAVPFKPDRPIELKQVQPDMPTTMGEAIFAQAAPINRIPSAPAPNPAETEKPIPIYDLFETMDLPMRRKISDIVGGRAAGRLDAGLDMINSSSPPVSEYRTSATRLAEPPSVARSVPTPRPVEATYQAAQAQSATLPPDQIKTASSPQPIQADSNATSAYARSEFRGQGAGPQLEPSIKGTPFSSSELGIQRLKQINFERPQGETSQQNTVPNYGNQMPPAIPKAPPIVTYDGEVQPAAPIEQPPQARQPSSEMPGRPLYTTPGFMTPYAEAPQYAEARPVANPAAPFEPPRWPYTPPPQKWPPRDDPSYNAGNSAYR